MDVGSIVSASIVRDSLNAGEKAPEPFEQGDADLLIRMLYFCSEEPKVTSQITSYCNIDRRQMLRFSTHCAMRGLLKIAPSDDGLLYLVTTERGKEVLATAQNVMRALGIELKAGKQSSKELSK